MSKHFIDMVIFFMLEDLEPIIWLYWLWY